MNFNQTNNNQGNVINNGPSLKEVVDLTYKRGVERATLICKRNAIMATIEIAKSGDFGDCNDDVESELSPILTVIKAKIAACDHERNGNGAGTGGRDNTVEKGSELHLGVGGISKTKPERQTSWATAK